MSEQLPLPGSDILSRYDGLSLAELEKFRQHGAAQLRAEILDHLRPLTGLSQPFNWAIYEVPSRPFGYMEEYNTDREILLLSYNAVSGQPPVTRILTNELASRLSRARGTPCYFTEDFGISPQGNTGYYVGLLDNAKDKDGFVREKGGATQFFVRDGMIGFANQSMFTPSLGLAKNPKKPLEVDNRILPLGDGSVYDQVYALQSGRQLLDAIAYATPVHFGSGTSFWVASSPKS